MLGHEDWERPFRTARDAVQRGDFDEIKNCLEVLGFCFKQGSDANHWIYYHSDLKADPIFRYPCNLYRPHGARRSSERIGKHDQSKAKQMIEALRTTRAAARKDNTEHPTREEKGEQK